MEWLAIRFIAPIPGLIANQFAYFQGLHVQGSTLLALPPAITMASGGLW
jgi:hypothetical protein